jgi:NAD(P)H-dependent flavin oxidoreductase YrpB (nitropropane dioxygenase family)
MKLPSLKIGDLIARLPIIQGGMGVGVSGSKLAGAVAKAGGVGIISGVQIGYREPDFETNTLEANIRAMKSELKAARETSPDGIIGVNLMVAITHYDEMVKASIDGGADIIISGAGLPMNLPKLVEGSNMKIAPIVSSGKAATLIIKNWTKKYSRLPDLVVVEGPEAGGHLGFKREELDEDKKRPLEDIVKEVIEAVAVFEEEHGKKIPVIAAGGIYTGEDIARFIKLGAAGVQMGTRFVATEECDADPKYKQAYLDAKKEDIQIIISPVGMPGRAVRNKLIKSVEGGRIPPKRCYDCIKKCNPKDTPYCISKALIDAVEGNVDEGLIFVGSNAYRLEKIVSVEELMNELVSEAEKI